MNREALDFGKLTDSATAFLETTEWHLEAYPGDDNRVRVVYPTLKTTSRWFSRNWKPIPWEFVAPIN